MLVLSRPIGSKIFIGRNREITVTVTRIKGDQVRIGVEYIATVGSSDDARLIAAAPDLLAACKAGKAAMDLLAESAKSFSMSMDMLSVSRVLEAAIAKATRTRPANRRRRTGRL